MSGSKEPSTTTVVNSSSSTQPSPQEIERNQLLLDRERFLDPQLRDVQSQGLNLSSLLLQGQPLPGYLGGLPGGISEDVIGGITNKAIEDLQPRFQSSGLLNSGVNTSISARTAGDIRTQAAQFNIQNLMQLLNQALGGQAQVQQPILGFSNNLTQGLQGLRSTNASSTSTQSQSGGPNPFLQGLGTGASVFASMGGFCWVAAELYGGWFEPKTINARRFFQFKAPKWMLKLYIKHGEKFAHFISNKPILKAMIKPLFDLFAKLGEE